MYYIYLIQSIPFPDQTYIGFTTDIEERMLRHNQCRSLHTKKYSPWKLISFLAFNCKKKALDFEKYLKVGSGHAFAKKRLW